MSSIKLKGSSSGDVTITVPAAAGTNTVTIPALTGTLPLSNLDHVTNRPNVKPLIINGNMAVSQRGTSTTGITATGYHAIDRMKVDLSDNGTWTQTQSTDVPAGQGFFNSWKLDCTTADTSVAAGAFHLTRYLFEGQDLQLLKKGTSSAEKVTISFWINATVTGTYIAELFDVDNSRQISQAYTVNSSNTWEKKVLSFVADTTGALNNDSSSSFAVQLWLGAGSNFSSGTLSTTWTSITNANRASSSATSFFDSTSRTLEITGLQMELGEQATPFEHRTFGDVLAACQRYYQQVGGSSSTIALGQCASTTQAHFFYPLPHPIRAQATISVNDETFFRLFNAAISGIPDVTSMTFVPLGSATNGGLRIVANVASGLSAGNASHLYGSDSDTNFGILKIDAEL